MKCVKLTCAECGKEFDKEKKEHTRRIKKGVERFFCSISCGCKLSNRESPRPGNIENLCIPSYDDLSPFR